MDGGTSKPLCNEDGPYRGDVVPAGRKDTLLEPYAVSIHQHRRYHRSVRTRIRAERLGARRLNSAINEIRNARWKVRLNIVRQEAAVSTLRGRRFLFTQVAHSARKRAIVTRDNRRLNRIVGWGVELGNWRYKVAIFPAAIL